MSYWRDMVVCHRKGFCHVTYDLCLRIHDLESCGRCPNFIKILENEEFDELSDIIEREERQELAPKRSRKKRRKSE